MNSMEAVKQMAICKFFPTTPGEREAIMDLLDNLAANKSERLQWLVDTMVNYVGEWHGPAQLRALYATRYRPADQNEGTHCTIAGFTPRDSERASLEAHESVKRIDDGKTGGGGLKRLN